MILIERIKVAMRSLTGHVKLKQKAHYVLSPEMMKHPADCLSQTFFGEKKKGNCLLEIILRNPGTQEMVKSRPQF